MAAQTDKNDDRRKRVFVGTLPNDFLRINVSSPAARNEQQEAADAQAAMALQQQLSGSHVQNYSVGCLNLTIVQAQLVKNYGMTRMDPYVRIRVGHGIYETNTDSNGGKTPKWNRDIQCLLPQGVTSIYIEIFDECSFTMDELIAWAQIPIAPSIFKGETYDDWFLLSGKQGEELEGKIQIVMSLTQGGSYGYYPLNPPVLAIPGGYGFKTYRQLPVAYTTAPIAPTVFSAPPPVSAPPAPQPSADDLKQIEEMFPNAEKEVIRSVYEANRFQKDLTVNCLLQMSD